MTKLFRTLLCGAFLALTLCTAAFAAQTELPVRSAPAQGDFQVLVNGTPVSFSDAVPKIRNNRSFLPMVAVFEQLGFREQDMTWDGTTKTVTASKAGLTVSLTIGKHQITLTRDGQTTLLDTDTAPYIDPALSRTYIPFGLLAQALGYRVGWDAASRTVIIDDVDAILAASPASYTLMDQYLAYRDSFCQQNQQITGSYTMQLTAPTEQQSQSPAAAITVGGSYDLLTAGGSAFQLNTKMTMDAAAAEASAASPQLPTTLDLIVVGDRATGTCYWQSAVLSQLTAKPGLEAAWFRLNSPSVPQRTEYSGVDLSTLIEMSSVVSGDSFRDALAATLKQLPLTSAGATTTHALALINAVYADSAFTHSGSGYTSKLEQNGLVLTVTLSTGGTRINGCQLHVTTQSPTLGTVEMVRSSKGQEVQLALNLASAPVGTSLFRLAMTLDGVYQPTSRTPLLAPPAGAVIVEGN